MTANSGREKLRLCIFEGSSGAFSDDESDTRVMYDNVCLKVTALFFTARRIFLDYYRCGRR